MKLMRNILILLIFITSFLACNNSVKGDDGKEQIIVNNITIQRFDKDLYEYLEYPTQEIADELIKNYPSLLPAFGQITIGKRIENDTTKFFEALSDYFAHPILSKMYKDEIQKFGAHIYPYEEVLSDAYKTVKLLYPEKKFPRFAAHVSGFKENVIVIDDIISLSVDKYLGEDYPLYEQYFTKNERNQMYPYMMPRDYLKAWIITENIVKTDEKVNLLTRIIEEGKILYLLHAIAQIYSKEELLGYTDEQIEWFINNEKYAWKETQKGNRLFSSDRQLISRYVDDIPVSMSILPEAPIRIGHCIGWRIVEEYALQTGKPIQEVLATDAQTILKGSKYKP